MASRWLKELDEILDVCKQRSRLPVALPHCAICARYSTDSLPFEALMSLFDVMPKRHILGALSKADEFLRDIPSSVKQISSDAATLPVLMRSPGWPLVRSLVLEAPLEALTKHFADDRLKRIEEITILGYAYGDYKIESSVLEGMLESHALRNVKALSLHSTRLHGLGERFWSSDFAARLERIDGVSYQGETAVRLEHLTDLRLFAYECDRLPLLSREVTPALERLSLFCSAQSLRLLSASELELSRLKEFSLTTGGDAESLREELAQFDPPKSLTQLDAKPSELPFFPFFDVDCHRYSIYESAEHSTLLKIGDKVTRYGDTVLHWNLINSASKGLRELGLLLPLDLAVSDLIHALESFKNLRRLLLVGPLKEEETRQLMKARQIQELDHLSLVLSLQDCCQCDLKSVDRAQYRDSLSPAFLCSLAFGEQSKAILELILLSETLDVHRDRDHINLIRTHSLEPVDAIVDCNPQQAIDTLSFLGTFGLSDAQKLASTDLLSRVYMLSIQMDEDAASVLAGCKHLRTIRALTPAVYAGRSDVAKFVNSKFVRGVWDLEMSSDNGSVDRVLAESEILKRVVAISLSGWDLSPFNKPSRVSRSGQLKRLRRMDEQLTIQVFGDARLARGWLESGATPQLLKKLRTFVDEIYRVEGTPKDLPELEERLRSPELREEDAGEIVRSLLAIAFKGKPIAKKQKFASLSARKQRVLKTIVEMEPDHFNSNEMIGTALTSYGFPVHESYQLRNYIEGRDLYEYPDTD